MTALYDRIGLNYADLRRPDPRIAAPIHAALGDAKSVLNIGAGTGSYEPLDRQVIAIEPSSEMIAQRRHPAAQVIQASAEAIPLPDNHVDAAMGILTLHHWTDQAQGLAEVRRVTRGPIVLLTFDPTFADHWLLDYFPANFDLDAAQFPRLEHYSDWLGDVEIANIPIPHDCTDGFLYAYWRRPHAYLDPRLRAASSTFHRITGIDEGVARLQTDLDNGTWADRHGHLLEQDTMDCGYRLVIAR